MSHLLYYWRSDHYLQDLDNGVGFHLNQASPSLHKINIGESLWAFTRNKKEDYVLAAQLVIKAKTKNPPHYKYGHYRVWGDLIESRYFDINIQKDISSIIKSFSIKTGKQSTVLGRAFQGNAAVREIQNQDHQFLFKHAKDIPQERRATLLPEDELEWLSFGESRTLVTHFLQSNPIQSVGTDRQKYLITPQRFVRNKQYRQELLEQYNGCCQITGWNPRKEYGLDLCEVHHVHWLSRGGHDEPSNLVLISPNIHRMLHSLDVPFDYEHQYFCLNQTALPLKINKHSLLPC